MSALAEIIVCITIMLFGGLCLYISSKKPDAVGYPVIATVVFMTNIAYSGTIPFSTDLSGAVVGTSSNIMLMGLNLILTTIALFLSVYKGFHVFTQK